MTDQSSPTASGRLVAEEPGRIGAAARGRAGWPLADGAREAWLGLSLALWRDAQEAAALPMVVRVRAAGAVDPLQR